MIAVMPALATAGSVVPHDWFYDTNGYREGPSY